MKRSRRIQFGISTVVVLTACVAGYLSAYRFATDEQIATNQQKISVRNYDVSDLLSGNRARSETDLAELQRLIEATTAGEWSVDSLTIQPYLANQSLVITQTGSGHTKIQKLIADLRSQIKLNAK
jgi:hypothetical protein